MQKNKRLLFLLSGLLVCTILGIVLLENGAAKPSQPEATEETLLWQIPTEAVTAVSWSEGKTPPLRLERDAAGNWNAPEQPSALLDVKAIDRMLTAFCRVVSGRELAEPDAAYGLNPPQRTITLTLEGEAPFRFSVGERNPYTNRYYLQKEGDTAIYTVGYSVGEQSQTAVEDYLLLPRLPGLALPFLEQLSITTAGKEQVLLQFPNGNPAYHTAAAHWFWKTAEGVSPVEAALAEQLLAGLEGLSVSRCVSLAPTEQQREDWGLISPQAILWAQYRPDPQAAEVTSLAALQLRLAIGAADSAGNCYVQLGDDPAVYQMDEAQLSPILSLATVDTTPMTLAAFVPDRAEKVRLTTAAGSREWQLHWQEDALVAVDGNEQKISAADMQAWLEAVSALRAQEQLPTPDTSVRELRGSIALSYHHPDDKTITLDFYNYNPTYDLVSVEGSRRWLILAETVEQLFSTISLPTVS